MKEPNFFIVGAPKCGTTSLAKWLGQHRSIFISKPKEPNYFNVDHKNGNYSNEAEYLHLFNAANETHLAVGEASVFYLYSKVAILNILKKYPKARIIVCLRDPVDLVVSLHNQHINSLYEDQLCLSMAWDAQVARQRGELLPPQCPDVTLLQYSKIGCLASQLDALFSICPHDQIKLIFLKDLKKDPQNIYREILRFLLVTDDGRDMFPVENAQAKLRSKLLKQILLVVGGFKKSLRLDWFSLGVMDWVGKKNLDQTSRNAPPEPDFIDSVLRPFFKDETERLFTYYERFRNDKDI